MAVGAQATHLLMRTNNDRTASVGTTRAPRRWVRPSPLLKTLNRTHSSDPHLFSHSYTAIYISNTNPLRSFTAFRTARFPASPML